MNNEKGELKQRSLYDKKEFLKPALRGNLQTLTQSEGGFPCKEAIPTIYKTKSCQQPLLFQIIS